MSVRKAVFVSNSNQISQSEGKNLDFSLSDNHLNLITQKNFLCDFFEKEESSL